MVPDFNGKMLGQLYISKPVVYIYIYINSHYSVKHTSTFSEKCIYSFDVLPRNKK